MAKIFFINSLWKHENHQHLLIFVSFHAFKCGNMAICYKILKNIFSKKILCRHENHQYLLIFVQFLALKSENMEIYFKKWILFFLKKPLESWKLPMFVKFCLAFCIKMWKYGICLKIFFLKNPLHTWKSPTFVNFCSISCIKMWKYGNLFQNIEKYFF